MCRQMVGLAGWPLMGGPKSIGKHSDGCHKQEFYCPKWFTNLKELWQSAC